MIDRDRQLRAQARGTLAPARDAQEILTELWRIEEANAHKFYRTDRKWSSNISYEQLAESGLQFAVGTESPDAIVSRQLDAETKSRLVQYLVAARRTLTSRQQEVITLMYEHHLTQAQTARKLNISRAAVSKTHHKALAALRDNLASTMLEKLALKTSRPISG
ncbi:sigma-70 family RNA polymerase sigma factor [Gulosibacter bifidus]|uniref:Sigma-70 family RNA polymerase sigma factor n=2 Tax=Gulosibacter bifidus TaxID=272239 RepID=A0ABW5RKB4_9MICO